MIYKLRPCDHFKRELKKLSKKYPSLQTDLESIQDKLLSNPQMGSEVYKNCYKIRLAIKSKGKGKSGGARLIVYVKVGNGLIHLLSIYDKSGKDTVTDAYIAYLLEKIEH
jgi:mRNA-degrading endonuclease RelE of RelBE toxin-antitoxin system